MVALLIALSVMSVMLTVALPTWRQMVQREKEAELVFRGEQYRRAIGLYQRRGGPGTLPPSIDVLVEERFLRKAYKDPMTGKDFVILRSGAAAGRGGAAGRGDAGGRGAQQGGRGAQQGARGGAQQGGRGGQTATGPTGGIIGVVSESELASIRLYNGRGFYNEWEFIYSQQGAAGTGAQGGAAGRGAERGRGGDGRGRGGGGDEFDGRGGRGRRGQPPAGRGRGPPAGRGRGPGGGQRGFAPGGAPRGFAIPQ